MDTIFLKKLLGLGKLSNNLAVRSLLSFVLHLSGIIPKSSSIAQFHPIPPSLATSKLIPPRKRLTLLYRSPLTLSCFFSPMFPSALQLIEFLTIFVHLDAAQMFSGVVCRTVFGRELLPRGQVEDYRGHKIFNSIDYCWDLFFRV
jgi:hypothetical protein